MSDFASRHFARASFLNIKVQSGTATAKEEAEYERIKQLRFTETRDRSVLYIEPAPITVDEWKAMIDPVNAENAQRLIDTVNPEESSSLDEKSGQSSI